MTSEGARWTPVRGFTVAAVTLRITGGARAMERCSAARQKKLVPLEELSSSGG